MMILVFLKAGQAQSQTQLFQDIDLFLRMALKAAARKVGA